MLIILILLLLCTSVVKPKKVPDKGASGGKEDAADSQKDGNYLHGHPKVLESTVAKPNQTRRNHTKAS